MNIKILKAFSQINNGIVLKEGEPIQTISPERNIFAIASDTADFTFGIYDIPQFLGALSLTNEDRKISVSGSVMEITDSRTKLKYLGASPNLIVTPPEDVTPLTSLPTDNGFKLSSQDIKSILQSCSVVNADVIKFVFEGDAVTIITTGSGDDSNSFEISVPCNVTKSGEVTITKDTLKVIDMDYDVQISDKAVILTNPTVTYYLVRAQ
jgi:hypothetical protein